MFPALSASAALSAELRACEVKRKGLVHAAPTVRWGKVYLENKCQEETSNVGIIAVLPEGRENRFIRCAQSDITAWDPSLCGSR
jgi:hypothetical protein